MIDKTAPPIRVLVADSISQAGVDLLNATDGIEAIVRTGMTPEQLRQTVGDFDGLIVRSATRVTAEALEQPGRLRVIGRAGTGVDNISLDAATGAGIVVMNTPGGNSLAAAELTMALLLAMARDVPQANSELREGRWERKSHMGVELAGKVLGLVGLGRIGREVALRAQSFRMNTIGFDPFVSSRMAADHGITFRSLEEVIAESDFISLHVPLSAETRHMINAETIAKMKPTARVINCARGGLIDEAALLHAVESGRLGGAALDVFESEPPSDPALVNHPRIVSTPHLGASTHEAQERVGVEIAEKIRDFFQSGLILDAVNFPSIGRKDSAVLGPVMDLAERLGSFLGQVSEGGLERLEVRTLGTMAEHSLKPVVMAAVKGLLARLVEGPVSYVNALSLARDRGITVEEGRSTETSPYAGLLRLTLHTDTGTTTVAGTLLAADRPRLVEVDDVPIEARPAGRLVFIRNEDVPGVVGRIGSILGQAGVNIAGIQLGRVGRDRAVSILSVDSAISAETESELRSVAGVLYVRTVTV